MDPREQIDLSVISTSDSLEVEALGDGIALGTWSTTSTVGTASCPSTAGTAMTAMSASG